MSLRHVEFEESLRPDLEAKRPAKQWVVRGRSSGGCFELELGKMVNPWIATRS